MRFSAPFLAACLAAFPTLAEPARRHVLEENGPPCLTASAALSNALSRGATAGRLDGSEAAKLLSAVNAIPPASDLRAETVIVLLRPDRAIVALFDACHMRDVTLRLDAFASAWRTARGDGV